MAENLKKRMTSVECLKLPTEIKVQLSLAQNWRKTPVFGKLRVTCFYDRFFDFCFFTFIDLPSLSLCIASRNSPSEIIFQFSVILIVYQVEDTP